MFDILYEDNHIIVVVKKPGILSQSDISGDTDMLTMVKNYIKDKYNKPGNVYTGLVHRLDRNVGGTMIFAKTSKGASRLSEQMRNKTFHKGYFSLCYGIPQKKSGTLINFLKKDEKSNTVFEHSSGSLCQLEYTVVNSYKNGENDFSLVYNVPITGRTHQIRVQMALMGHPLLGDNKYGQKYEKSTNKTIGLWSSVIRVKHPTKDEIMTFKSLPYNIYPWDLFHKNIIADCLAFIEEMY